MIPNFNEEKILWKQGFKFVVGLDEAGRGPLAGPVVAGAVLFKPAKKILLKGINDSKKLSAKQREKIFEILTKHPKIEWGIGIVSEKIIDKINILEASKLAMQKAVYNLGEKMCYQKTRYRVFFDNSWFLLLDGNFTINSIVRQKAVVKGDQKVVSIAAASIIAKVTRDRIMEKYNKKYPQYKFDKHKGYPTKLHVEMLKKFGACPIHRKSFQPVRDLK